MPRRGELTSSLEDNEVVFDGIEAGALEGILSLLDRDGRLGTRFRVSRDDSRFLKIFSQGFAVPSPVLSVVIPFHNESGNILPLLAEVEVELTAYARVGTRFEVVAVDDASTDSTAQELQEAQTRWPWVRVVRHVQRLGLSGAQRNGIRRARAPWILTMDGDGQNDPADGPRLCEIAWGLGGPEPRVVVAGLRIRRRDTLAKRLASRSANAVRRLLLRDKCPDTGCGLKLFPRESYLELPFFKGLHRFMPALFRLYGHEILFTPVNDRLRVRGVSKSDFLGRALQSLADLVGVVWLIRRTPPPERGNEEGSSCP